MTTTDTCGEFLAAVEKLRDDGTVRLTAHTSSVSADAWTTPISKAQETSATPMNSTS
ncbi:hypothetical protein ACFWNT_13730 [Streptomyces sp. NPDC058409]|uniref:hypothetical protein n=1 Tax=Streptomyces sp. NPDC058409 TaxID=3346484 RepID=UPI00365DB81C